MSIESLIERSGQECSILATTAAGSARQTATGGVDRTAAGWSSVADGVPCLVRPTGSSLNLGNDTMSNQEYLKVYLAGDPVPGGISVRHRLAVTRAGDGSPNAIGTYNVISVVDANGRGRLIEVGCERLAGG